MSKNIWDDEPFRDGQPVYENGKWQEAATYAPVPENTIVAARAIQQQAQAEEEFDVEEFVEEAASDEDEDDFTEVLSDARLRLEQGKLYEMVMNHDLFGGVESDPRAAKSVQKQIRKFAKEQMEIMLGMRQEEVAVTNATSDFSSLEVHALKDIAAKLISTRGMKEEDYPEEPAQGTPAAPPKKKTLNTIGSSKHKPQSKPIAKKAEPIKRQAKPKVRNDLPKEFEMDYQPLDKPIHEMTPAELAQRDAEATERQKNKMVITPKEQRAHWPSYEEQTALAQAQVSRVTNSQGNLSALIVANLKNAGKL